VTPSSLQPFAAAEGASIFQVAATKATTEDVDKVRALIGPIDSTLFVDLYQKTHNPVWLWLTIAVAQQPQDIPPEAFDYLRRAGSTFLRAVAEQVCSAETVRITPAMEVDEAISRRIGTAPPLPDVLQILELSHPGRNLIGAAAADIRDLSVAIAVENLVRKSHRTRAQSRAFVAEALGRNSAETGPVVASIKHMETRGRKLASIPRTKR
jgi:hypothetical protein